MFRKKQVSEPARRNVQRSPSANVFSYYSARSATSEISPARQPEARLRRLPPIPVRLLLTYMPTVLALMALLVSTVYCSTLTATPKIQAISNQGARTIARNTNTYQDEAGAILGRSLMNRSKLLIDTAKVEHELRQAFPELGDVTVIIPLVSRRPIIEVQPAKAVLILTSSSGAYVVDQDGRAVIEARDVDSSVRDPLPVVQDESDISIARGKGVLSADTVTFIKEFTGQLTQKRVAIQSIILPVSAHELHIRLAGQPYTVKLDLKGAGRQQAGTLLAVKEKLEAEGVTPGVYIDVRVPEKAFYK